MASTQKRCPFCGKVIQIKIELKEKNIQHNIFPVRKEHRMDFFPGYKEDFFLETMFGKVKVHRTSASRGIPGFPGIGNKLPEKGTPNVGSYIYGGRALKSVYEKHKVKAGDKLIIEIIEPNQKYLLSIEKKEFESDKSTIS